MKSKKMQSHNVLWQKVVSNLTLASTFLISSMVGVQAAFAAERSPIFIESGLTTVDEASNLLAQVDASSIIYFRTQNYIVNVYNQGGRTLMNVYRPSTDTLFLNRVPAQFVDEGIQGAYVSSGGFENRQARFSASFTPDRLLRLVITDGAGTQLVNEPATVVEAFRVPEEILDGLQRDTNLLFSTGTYTVRVFNRGNPNQKFMNVFNEATRIQEVNGQPATLVSGAPPFENAVSYVSSGTFNGQPAEYFARFDPGRGGVLEVFNVGGQRLFQQTAQGPITLNIPPGDYPPGFEPPESVDNAYIAAVFGDDSTLAAVQTLYPSAFFDSARQGRFINAGSFTNRNSAASRVLELRGLGFDSRVLYRRVNYR